MEYKNTKTQRYEMKPPNINIHDALKQLKLPRKLSYDSAPDEDSPKTILKTKIDKQLKENFHKQLKEKLRKQLKEKKEKRTSS